VEFSGALVGGLLTIVAYAVIAAGLYKIFQIATDIREIKDMVASARRSPLGATPPVPGIAAGLAPVISQDLMADDSASAYAEQLLRAVKAESQVKETEVR
jgi:hypothetical protein